METRPISRKPILIWLIASQLLALASLVFWLFAAGISVMSFDSGVTQEAWNFVIAVWAYPIWPIVFTIAAWIAYARKKDRLAAVLTTLTFLPVLVLILVTVFSSFFYCLSQNHPGNQPERARLWLSLGHTRNLYMPCRSPA